MVVVARPRDAGRERCADVVVIGRIGSCWPWHTMLVEMAPLLLERHVPAVPVGDRFHVAERLLRAGESGAAFARWRFPSDMRGRLRVQKFLHEFLLQINVRVWSGGGGARRGAPASATAVQERWRTPTSCPAAVQRRTPRQNCRFWYVGIGYAF